MSASTILATVARGRKRLPGWAKLGLLGVGSVAVVGGIYWMALPSAPKSQTALQAQRQQASTFDFGLPLQEPSLPPAKPHAVPPAETATAAPPPPSTQSATPPPETATAPPPPPAAPPAPLAAPMVPWERPDAAALLIKPRQTAPAGAKEDGDDEDGAAPGAAGPSSPLADSLRATRVADSKPAYRRFPPGFTLRKGQTISCTPPMPLETQLPGPLFCLTDMDTMSMDGTNRLIPAGSQVNLQIERGLSTGQTRAQVVATDVLTTGPAYLPIPLTGLGADSGGQIGLPVDVDEHTWQRLRVALIAAGVEGVSGAAQAYLQKGSNQYVGSFGNQAQGLASVFAQRDSGAYPPTGARGRARPVSIYIPQYIDLSNFYRQGLAVDPSNREMRR